VLSSKHKQRIRKCFSIIEGGRSIFLDKHAQGKIRKLVGRKNTSLREGRDATVHQGKGKSRCSLIKKGRVGGGPAQVGMKRGRERRATEKEGEKKKLPNLGG